MAEQAAIQTCIDLNLFQALADGGEKPVGLAELAKKTGADAKLLGKSEDFLDGIASSRLLPDGK